MTASAVVITCAVGLPVGVCPQCSDWICACLTCPFDGLCAQCCGCPPMPELRGRSGARTQWAIPLN